MSWNGESAREFWDGVASEAKKLHLIQGQLVTRLNMSNRTIMDIENAKIVPQLDTVVYIVRELGISLDALIFPNA